MRTRSPLWWALVGVPLFFLVLLPWTAVLVDGARPSLHAGLVGGILLGAMGWKVRAHEDGGLWPPLAAAAMGVLLLALWTAEGLGEGWTASLLVAPWPVVVAATALAAFQALSGRAARACTRVISVACLASGLLSLGMTALPGSTTAGSALVELGAAARLGLGAEVALVGLLLAALPGAWSWLEARRDGPVLCADGEWAVVDVGGGSAVLRGYDEGAPLEVRGCTRDGWKGCGGRCLHGGGADPG